MYENEFLYAVQIFIDCQWQDAICHIDIGQKDEIKFIQAIKLDAQTSESVQMKERMLGSEERIEDGIIQVRASLFLSTLLLLSRILWNAYEFSLYMVANPWTVC